MIQQLFNIFYSTSSAENTAMIQSITSDLEVIEYRYHCISPMLPRKKKKAMRKACIMDHAFYTAMLQMYEKYEL